MAFRETKLRTYNMPDIMRLDTMAIRGQQLKLKLLIIIDI